MFHCCAVRDQFDGILPELFTDKSASIVKFKIHTDIQQRCLESDSVQYVDALTCRNFPGYTPPVGLTGNILCISYNELPQAKSPAIEYINMMGELTLCQDWFGKKALEIEDPRALEYDVYCTLFYRDTYWDVQENYALKRLDLA